MTNTNIKNDYDSIVKGGGKSIMDANVWGESFTLSEIFLYLDSSAPDQLNKEVHFEDMEDTDSLYLGLYKKVIPVSFFFKFNGNWETRTISNTLYEDIAKDVSKQSSFLAGKLGFPGP